MSRKTVAIAITSWAALSVLVFFPIATLAWLAAPDVSVRMAAAISVVCAGVVTAVTHMFDWGR